MGIFSEKLNLFGINTEAKIVVIGAGGGNDVVDSSSPVNNCRHPWKNISR